MMFAGIGRRERRLQPEGLGLCRQIRITVPCCNCIVLAVIDVPT